MESELRSRLEKLERENRTMKRVGLSALLVLGATLLMGQAAPRPKFQQQVRTQSLVLVNAKGEQFGGLLVHDDNTVSLSFGGPGGPMLQLAAGRGARPTGIALTDSAGALRAQLSFHEARGVLLGLHDSTGTVKAMAAVENNGNTLSLWSNSGTSNAPSPPQRNAASAPAQRSGARGYIVDAAADDETFIINGNTYKAKTYCFDVDKGDEVLFTDSSAALGVCVSAEFINLRTREGCEVWCE
jgi:hypothetical protein